MILKRGQTWSGGHCRTFAPFASSESLILEAYHDKGSVNRFSAKIPEPVEGEKILGHLPVSYW